MLVDLVFNFVVSRQSLLITVHDAEDHKAARSAYGIGDITFLLLEDDVAEFFSHLVAPVAGQFTAIAGGFQIVGIGRREVAEFLALARTRHQVLGFSFSGCNLLGSLTLGGNHDLLQENSLIAHEIIFVLFIVFLHFRLGNVDLLAHLFADHALGQKLVLHLLFEIFKWHAHLLADEIVEFIRVADLALHLHGCQALGDLAIHVDIEVLGFLDQQELIDLVAQGVGGFLLESLLQLGAVETLLAKLSVDLLAGPRQLAARNDVVIHFGDNLFDGVNVGGRSHGDGSRKKENKPAIHITDILAL